MKRNPTRTTHNTRAAHIRFYYLYRRSAFSYFDKNEIVNNNGKLMAKNCQKVAEICPTINWQ